jgi:hypothetical protein
MLHHLRTAEELCLPSAADGQGRTPLHAAAQSNRHKHSVDTVRALIEAGADIEAEDNMVCSSLLLSLSFALSLSLSLDVDISMHVEFLLDFTGLPSFDVRLLCPCVGTCRCGGNGTFPHRLFLIPSLSLVPFFTLGEFSHVISSLRTSRKSLRERMRFVYHSSFPRVRRCLRWTRAPETRCITPATLKTYRCETVRISILTHSRLSLSLSSSLLRVIREFVRSLNLCDQTLTRTSMTWTVF